MSGAHTPGPWSVGSLTHVDELPVIKILGPDDRIIAFVRCQWRDAARIRRAYADAGLISEATEMLSALRAVEAWWLNVGAEKFSGTPYEIHVARSVIAEVTGESERVRQEDAREGAVWLAG